MEANNIILIIFILSIIFNALGDGFRMQDIKYQNPKLGVLYHTFWALNLLALLSLILVPGKNIDAISYILYLVGYALMRFGIFDTIHNFAAGKHLQYIGNTSAIDRFLAKIANTGTKKTVLSGIRYTIFIIGMALIQHI